MGFSKPLLLHSTPSPKHWLTEGLPLSVGSLGLGAQGPSLAAQRPQGSVGSHAGSLTGRGFVPYACHSELLRGQWGFCEL